MLKGRKSNYEWVWDGDEEVKRALQVMLSSEEPEQIVFLETGGFQCKRKCHEVEVFRENYLVRSYGKVDLGYCEKGCAEYDLCGQLLYRYYAETHKAINRMVCFRWGKQNLMIRILGNKASKGAKFE